MPSVSDIYGKIRSGALTASDCVELFGASTETQGEAHPPHPHAHISKDGFRFGESTDVKQLRAEMIWLREKLNNKYTNRPPAYESWKKSFPKVQQAILKLEGKKGLDNTEGVHIDPVLMQRMIPAKYRLDQPGMPDYSNRVVHSQFEDSETAIMALFFALNCPAGKNAIYEISNGWFFSASWNRVTIQSLTAVKGLNKGPIAPAPAKDGSAPSAHPLRNAGIGMIERGAGAAGQGATPGRAIGRVTTVLDRIGSDQLRVVTHFPVVAWAPPAPLNAAAKANTHDFIQFVNFAKNEREWKDYPSGEPATMKW